MSLQFILFNHYLHNDVLFKNTSLSLSQSKNIVYTLYNSIIYPIRSRNVSFAIEMYSFFYIYYIYYAIVNIQLVLYSTND